MMAITRRTARRSEPCLNGLEGTAVVESMLSVRQSTSSSNMNMAETDSSTSLQKQKTNTSWFSRRQRQKLPPSITPLPPSPTASSSLWKQLLVPRGVRIKQIKSYLRSKSPRHVAVASSFLLIALWVSISILIEHLFGPKGSVKGGQFGYLIDQYAKDYVRYHTMSKWRNEIQTELHIPLVHSEQDGTLLEPRFWPFDVIIKTRPNVAVVEMLLREKTRVQKLADMVQSTADADAECLKDPSSNIDIPWTILQLEHRSGQMNQLLPYWITRSEWLEMDSFAVYKKDVPAQQQSINTQTCQSLISGIDNYAVSTDIGLHCLAYRLGGMQLSSPVTQHHRVLVDDVLKLVTVTKGSCNSKIGYAVLSNIPTPELELRRTSSIMSYVSTIYSALPPSHPAAICLPPFLDEMGISPYTEANLELKFQSIFVNRLVTTISHARSNLTLNGTDTVWGIATFYCDFETDGLKCCNDASVSLLESGDVNKPNFVENFVIKDSSESKSSQHLVFTVSDVDSHMPKQHTSTTVPLSVSIKEQSNNSNNVSHPKQSIQDSFQSCKPRWWCNRCLQTSLYGSFSKCQSVCNSCVADIICGGVNTNKHKQVTVNVNAKGSSIATPVPHGIQLTPQRIPRICHQTWFEDITLESYPQLYRLQNTWRASGWEYRFYTDDTARKYIQENYPLRFVTVFDSLVPGAYKADFFRYLVLYKDGGIYVDVDVMLNANLDSFITPDLAFFAPMDAVGSYADEHFCVWNGLLGSAPAHPILSYVIEWMVNLVSSRADMYDMERSVCQFSGGKDRIENWKLRAEPSLMLSGPCALGLAVNNALGNEPLASFNAGLIKRDGFNQRNFNTSSNKDQLGDVMILIADKQDLGAFRFSDPERNIVVATTDMNSLSKSPMVYEVKTFDGKGMLRTGETVKPHYSISTRGQELWGTHDVYSDNMAISEHVSLVLSYED
ncbi:hypothetical protein ACHAXN_013469 [Cyclotella atomus]